MRKTTIVLAALMAVAMTGTADAAKKKRAKAPAPTISAQEQSNMLIRDAFQPWNTKYAAPAKATPAKKGKKSKKRA